MINCHMDLQTWVFSLDKVWLQIMSQLLILSISESGVEQVKAVKTKHEYEKTYNFQQQ